MDIDTDILGNRLGAVVAELLVADNQDEVYRFSFEGYSVVTYWGREGRDVLCINIQGLMDDGDN